MIKAQDAKQATDESLHQAHTTQLKAQLEFVDKRVHEALLEKKYQVGIPKHAMVLAPATVAALLAEGYRVIFEAERAIVLWKDAPYDDKMSKDGTVPPGGR